MGGPVPIFDNFIWHKTQFYEIWILFLLPLIFQCLIDKTSLEMGEMYEEYYRYRLADPKSSSYEKVFTL
jgi:hypothetical protein